jgi:superfamily II DNA or RNA helicase
MTFTTQTDHWKNRTIDFLTPHLENARQLIRIATGFFTVEGYELIRSYLVGKHVHLLVGFDETSKERLRQKLIDDVLFHLSRWDAQNRRAAVEDLVQKLRNGEFILVESQSLDESLDARIRNKDHAKIYLIDEQCVVVGSSNLTISGLRYNTEGVGIIDDKERVASWSTWFEQYWNAEDTQNLTQELLDALLRWLGFSSPYEIYLKTLLALVHEENPEPPRPSYKFPVEYQRVVVARMLRQLGDWRGAMLVASTGLGKTVMATHLALLMQRAGKILNVIVFAPLQIQADWQEALFGAGLSYQIFTRNLLDQPNRSKGRGEVQKILDVLSGVDERCLIIIDESQYFTNRLRAKDGEVRHSFSRLLEASEQRKPFIVLLTATPLLKGVEDLNNQLLLLPHTAPPSYLGTDRQWVMPGVGDEMVDIGAWRVLEYDDFTASFDDFMRLQVCTVISTSQVAKDFATSTPEGDYVDFGDERMWLPQIEVRKVNVPIPFETEMSEALDQDYFRHRLRRFQTRGQWRLSESTIEQEACTSWSSSPLALEEVIQNTIQDEYDVDFIRSKEARKEKLDPLLEKIKALRPEEDQKLVALSRCLREFYDKQQKVIIFTERHATAYYLERNLPKLIPNLKVASVVKKTRNGFELRDFDKEVFNLMVDFAPEANRGKIVPGQRSKHYDVFISTDAYGVGVNLQDACVVISYDLAWTPDVIIQRAGRILRFWKRPRRVYLYAFVDQFGVYGEGKRAANKVNERLERLTLRSKQAEQFSEIPLIPTGDRHEINSLGDLSSFTIENLGLADIVEIEEFTGVSPFLIHVTELQHNQELVRNIPDDISSAILYRGKEPKIYMLLRYKRIYHWFFYGVETKKLTLPKEDELLDLIRCTPVTATAAVDADIVEQLAQEAKARWCKKQKITEEDQVERICALFLMPDNETDDFSKVLGSGKSDHAYRHD